MSEAMEAIYFLKNPKSTCEVFIAKSMLPGLMG